MSLPLYKNHNAPEKFDIKHNTGLWYDKFYNEWTDEGAKGWKLGDKKDDWIKTVTKRKIGKAELILEMTWRLSNIVKRLNGKTGVFKTQWRFVTGLGLNHPVENGFAWHHNLGVPYLPGSSVKGMVRAWATNWEYESDKPDKSNKSKEEKQIKINRIFGGGNAGEKNAGSVIFFDALPTGIVKLDLEIMTRHYSEYYRNDDALPADWLSPEPIPFLTVAPEQAFVFAVAPRCQDDNTAIRDVKDVMKWLKDALTWCGAGAKTAAGYGRFMPDDKAEEAWRRRIKELQSKEEQAERRLSLVRMSPVRQEMEQDGYSDNQDNFMLSMGKKWLNRLDEPGISSEIRLEIASLLVEWYQRYRPDQWKKPNKKNKAKIAKIKSVLK